MPDALDILIEQLDFDRVRVIRPTRFAFVCGGRIETAANARTASVRDYLLRIRNMEKSTGFPLVLAESAQQLYRDTTYNDLITFEEDIAAIASIVLVISESAGALAELGAFSSTDTIRQRLRVIISESHANEESFVRYGPIERIKRIDRQRIGIYPWRLDSSGRIIKLSISPHYHEMCRFLREHIDKIPATEARINLKSDRIFYDILWLVHLCRAVSPLVLYDLVRRIHPDCTDEDIRNKLFSMKVAGWTDQVSYSGKDYYFAKHDADPYEYAFVRGAVTDSARRKVDVRKVLREIETPHRTVFARVMAAQAVAAR